MAVDGASQRRVHLGKEGAGKGDRGSVACLGKIDFPIAVAMVVVKLVEGDVTTSPGRQFHAAIPSWSSAAATVSKTTQLMKRDEVCQ